MKKMFFALLMMLCFTAMTDQPANAGAGCDFRQDDLPAPRVIPENFTSYWERKGNAHSMVVVDKMTDIKKQEEVAEKRAYETLRKNYGEVKKKDIKVFCKKRNPDTGKLLFVIETPIKKK